MIRLHGFELRGLGLVSKPKWQFRGDVTATLFKYADIKIN